MLENSESASEWIMQKVGALPKTSLGWFRAGVGFYNKKRFEMAIQCLERAIQADPLNYNAFQIVARAYIAVNRRADAITALQESVKLDNPSDWQLLVELTSTPNTAVPIASSAKTVLSPPPSATATPENLTQAEPNTSAVE
eukprot:GCRY01003430.1.p1 GENE.GCRY01003430.1~~GCRY01003430.1.p1  ORF type:complete len:141 (-),score=30.77 GCRY01003430.1:122-544(-)